MNGYDCEAVEKIILDRKPPLSPYYNPKFVSHEKRPLSHASALGDMEIVKLLLRHGAIVTEPDVRHYIIYIFLQNFVFVFCYYYYLFIIFCFLFTYWNFLPATGTHGD